MARGRFKQGRGRGGGGGRGRGRGRGGGGGGGRQFQDNRESFTEVNKRNDKFERFYNSLNIVPEGAERDAFWTALRRELPNAFRFTGSKGHALGVKKNLVERFFPLIRDIKHEGKSVELPKAMPWYPEGLAYSMTTPKNVVRKYEPFKEFQKFLVSETGVGNISRQEQVSMIPPLVMDIRPEHTVLDLCAAPGSKSAQLIEAIHAGEEDRVARAIKKAKGGEDTNGAALNGDANLTEDQGRSTGLLIANDVNYQRAQMLVHQVKRLNSPNLIVMNHDATQFPSIQLPSEDGKKGKYLKFDRILADVPCSGDGTCRKNPNIWKDWSPQNGLGLYITQVRILTRALQMLKVGGRVVYSTCSMNPVEDECVVSSAIERCGGVAKVKLIDCSDRLPGLVRAPGLTDWSIMSRTGQIYESWPEAESNEAAGGKIVPGMFAPGADENIPLQHCMRVYPHMQDTGGFFIAVLEKLSEIKAKPENESKCMNKTWTFSEPKEDTVFGELMADVRSESTDAQGHLIRNTMDPDTMVSSTDVSAAARQNTEDSGTKRKADEDLAAIEAVPKKPRYDADEPADLTSTSNTARKERGPLPPVVAQAVEAAGGEPGSQMEGDDDGASKSDTQIIPEPVEDAALNAPFDTETVPPSAIQAAQKQRRSRDGPTNEESFKYLSPDHAELESIYKFYELHPSFPRDRFLVRNPAGDPVKGIYYSSQLAKDILTTNAEGKGLKFVHAGVKMFMKQDAQGQDICRWRIQTEGLPIIEGWVGEGRVVRLWKKATLRKLLVEMFPKIGKAEDGPEAGWRQLGEIGEQVLGIGMGCCVLRVEARKGDEGEEGLEEALTLPLWRSLHSLNLMLPKEDRKAMLLRIFDEDVELINHSDPGQKGSDAAVRREREEAEAEGRGGANGGNGSGSIPAEDDAKALQQKYAEVDDDATDVIQGEGQVEDVKAANLEWSARAMEADGEAKRDRMEAERLEGMEDEDTKIGAAMAERVGEGDEFNTTV
ncbi:hypothetical protein LTR36_007213 [Oleoguttula mirabilis]|uniref:SAM-dependent MTase RsmB/NOP-type domain-containing protein n=1 Tax=Oleoguttula mirabilis TaxID=1507867 RepID=A0AAV9JC77_9PEZI|nr:hypothetical protein LTR36_007213 [Oleoguttula mirabilis]